MLLSLSVSAGVAADQSYQGDPQAIAEVQAATQKFLAVRTWRARLTPPGREPQLMEYVAPNRFHMVPSSQGTQQSDMYIIGGEVWAHVGGACQKMPVAVPFANPREVMEHPSDGTIVVARGGAETVEGTSTQAYVITTVDAQDRKVQQKLLVATGTGLPRRVVMASDRGTTVIDYLDYGAQIAINDPPC